MRSGVVAGAQPVMMPRVGPGPKALILKLIRTYLSPGQSRARSLTLGKQLSRT